MKNLFFFFFFPPTRFFSPEHKHEIMYLGEEEFAVEQVGKLDKALLHCGTSAILHIQVPAQWRLAMTREKDALGVHLVIQKRNPRSHQIT